MSPSNQYGVICEQTIKHVAMVFFFILFLLLFCLCWVSDIDLYMQKILFFIFLFFDLFFISWT